MDRPWYVVARELARARGITYLDLAEALNVNKSTVGHWLTGRNNPRLQVIARIATLLNTTVTELISEDAYFLTDPQERRGIDQLREIPADKRQEAIDFLATFAAMHRSHHRNPKE